ncbi:hypothetical protein POM88_016464 [Heracleum sosnowskyi]|uniref:DUF7769 domain-containing protein n=1 Tax=Heracleum sosnowskyi TaxID=360622 RepID=A0AAD8INX2_9APIA|nr:hypothetical protein POM88_016464 [Heracleum sosnowskyi]
MSLSHNFDLNLPPVEDNQEIFQNDEAYTEEEGSNNVHLFDLNIPLEDDSEEDHPPIIKRTNMLSNEERRLVYLALLRRSTNKKLRQGTIPDIAQLFSISKHTVSCIWKQSKNTRDGVVDVSHHKTKNCGRKRITIDREQFKSIPLSKRTTIRSLACATDVSKSALHRKVQSDDDIRRHTNPVKPLLKDANKKA